MKSILFLLILLVGFRDLLAEGAATYRVAVILPLSGEYASLGIYSRKGIDLAYQLLSPELKRRVELFYSDDQLDSKKSIGAFQQLASTKGIDAVLVISSGVGNALAPITEKQRKIMIAVGASDKNIAAGRKYVFTHWVSPEIEAQKMAAEIKRRRYKRLAFLASEQEGAIALMRALRQELKGSDVEILMEQQVLLSERDFRTFIAVARTRGVQGVAVGLLPGALSSFAKQSRSARLDADIFGFEIFEDAEEVKASDGALIGKWYVNADESGPAFREAYRKAYGEEPGFGSANCYDSLNLIAGAVEQVGMDNDKIAVYLHTIKD